jgi:hypothetical protein
MIHRAHARKNRSYQVIIVPKGIKRGWQQHMGRNLPPVLLLVDHRTKVGTRINQ